MKKSTHLSGNGALGRPGSSLVASIAVRYSPWYLSQQHSCMGPIHVSGNAAFELRPGLLAGGVHRSMAYSHCHMIPEHKPSTTELQSNEQGQHIRVTMLLSGVLDSSLVASIAVRYSRCYLSQQQSCSQHQRGRVRTSNGVALDSRQCCQLMGVHHAAACMQC